MSNVPPGQNPFGDPQHPLNPPQYPPQQNPNQYGQVAPQYDISQDIGVRMLIPVGRSVWAILAGYFGLFAVLCVPAPLAILFGILGIRSIRNNPKLGGMGRCIFGIVMGSIFTLMMVGFFVIAMLDGLSRR